MAFGFYEGAGRTPELPHPPISLSVFLIIENGLRAAWELMRADPRPGFDLLNAVEDDVTQELQERLFDEVFDKDVVDGFNRELLVDITREGKVRNYDRTHLDKMPDLHFALIGRLDVYRKSQDGLFVECKPVDKTHTVGKHYCGMGIIRFVCGDYAWSMTSALMVGYTRAGYTIDPKLTDALKAGSAGMHTLTYPYQCRRSKSGPSSEVVYISRHERTFIYTETGKPAGAITIRHLWLRRD